VLAPGAVADAPPSGRALPPVDEPTRDDALPFSWQVLDTGSIATFVAVDVVSPDVAWFTSSDTAEVFLTLDGGDSFTNVAPEEGAIEGLQFYDVEAKSADEAIVLASGTGPLSRVYRTTDGGASWEETFRAVDDLAFFNCLAMFDSQRGFGVGDAVDGKYQIITTDDAGATWSYVPDDAIPDAQPGEFEWASSGLCANATGRKGFFGTGAATEARVIRTTDYGASWEMASTTMPAGPSGGIMGVDFRTNKVGLATGGDFTSGVAGMARTTDGGVTWELLEASVAPQSYRTGIAWWSDIKGDERVSITDAQKTVFAVGPTGSDVSTNRGKTWTAFDSTGLNTIDCLAGTSICMAAGGGGVIATLAVG
jgi:photosystem II stability/assembly factor-like uncharacterized protein